MQNILPTTTTDTTSPDVQLDVSSSAPTSFPTRPSAIHNQRSSSSSSSVAQNQNRASNDLALSSMAQQSRPTADANDDDFLLPLKPTQRSARDELLDGAEERSGGGQVGMKGARELHDELGEELAKVSPLPPPLPPTSPLLPFSTDDAYQGRKFLARFETNPSVLSCGGFLKNKNRCQNNSS